MSTSPATGYAVVVPVKPPAVAKSRLSGLGPEQRSALAAAFALDTVETALATPQVGLVLVTTDDVCLARELAALGAAVVPDAVVDDLNALLVQGAAEAARRRPMLRAVALCADLPAARPDELSRALTLADTRPGPSFVSDSERVGTTMLVAGRSARLAPAFGPHSRAAHLAAGAEEVHPEPVPGLRRDVDTVEDLRRALALGAGPRTSAAAASAGVGPEAS